MNKRFKRTKLILLFLVTLLSGCGGGTATSEKGLIDEIDFHSNIDTLSSTGIESTAYGYQEDQNNPIIDKENYSNDLDSENSTDNDNSNGDTDVEDGSTESNADNDESYDPPSSRSVNLVWNPPTKDADGSSLTGLAGYIVYYGPSKDNYSHLTSTNFPHTTIMDLPYGTWCFAVTAYDDWGNESEHSESICISLN